MKRIGIWSALLAAALVATYVSYYDGDEGTDDDTSVAVYRADANDVQRIRWQSAELDLDVERRSDERGDYVWVTATETTTTRTLVDDPHDHDHDHDAVEVESEAGDEVEDEAGDEVADEVADEPVFEETTETRTTSFKGNEAADKLWESFSPLQAAREFGDLGDRDPTVFGLVEPEATLAITRRSGELVIELGGEAYGSKDRYVRYDGRVFLVDDATLRPLQYGKTRLVDRVVQPYKESDVEQVVVARDMQAVTFTHENKDDPGKAYWANAEAPDGADDAAGTWIGKVFRMRVQTYASPDEVEGTLEPRFTYEVQGTDGSWKVEVLQEAGDGEFYARSEYGRSLVKLTRTLASEAVADLDTVLPE